MVDMNAGEGAIPAGAGPEQAAPIPAAGECFLHRLFEAQARRTPDSVALVFEEQSLTYRELDARSDRLAQLLKGLGVGPEMLVGLFVERSPEMIVGMLGILKAGGAYLPIDPACPQERVAFMLTDAGVSVLLTQDSLWLPLPPGVTHRIELDQFDWAAAQQEGHKEGHNLHAASTAETADIADTAIAAGSPENLAYVIYTSGSTGRPKGVCVEHRNIVSYVMAVIERFGFTPGLNYATVSTIAADLGNTVIFPALVTGGCLHVIAQERTENRELLADYFSRERIDVLKIVPSHLAALLNGKDPARLMPRRCLILGGESTSLDWLAGLPALAPDCAIHNHYGPSETTVGVLTYPVGPSLPETQSGTLPLGKPLPNSRAYILDTNGWPAPVGALGELYIGGGGVARGYLNSPDLTAEKFVTYTLRGLSGERLYRSGDLARYLPDGNIEFCGRSDHQVKIHGNRVELGEIEKTIRAQGGVRNVVVLANADESGDRQLVAYVVPTRANQPLWENQSLHVLPDGMPVAHLNRNETDYIYHEIFVMQAYLRHGITINDGDCIVDAGSNIGLFTVFASRLANDLEIISFEPNPAAFSCLKANAEAWGGAVKYLQNGLSNENKSAEMIFFEGLSLLSGYYADADVEHSVVKNYVANQRSEAADEAENKAADDSLVGEIDALISDRLRARTVSTQLRTLSSVIAEEGITRIDLLKINVEKSELDVLRGINSDDWPKIRQLVVEVDQQQDLEPIQTLLIEQGFETLTEQDPLLRETELCYVYAIRPSATGKGLVRQKYSGAHLRSLPPVSTEILTPATLRKYLKERLPQYMIPSAFVLLSELPLTANGKIDRQALAAVAPSPRPAASAFAGPQSATEKALAAIWSDLLKVEQIGIHDDFFDLGGHSLMAIRVVSRIRDTFEVNLPLRNLFEHPTVAGLAEVIDGLVWMEKSDALPPDASGPSGLSGLSDREEIAL